MRKTLRWTGYAALAGLALLTGGHLTLGQRPARKESAKALLPKAGKSSSAPEENNLATIEEMLATALKYNPDIRLSEVKVRDAEGELNRTRLRVMQRVIALHHTIQAQQAEVARVRARVKRLSGLVSNRAVQRSLLEEARQDLLRERSKLSELKAELPYLLGKQDESLAQEAVRTEVQIGTRRYPPSRIRAPMAGRLLKALDKVIEVDYKAVTLDKLLEDLQEKAEGVPIHRNLALADLGGLKFGMRLGKVPLGSALLALQDALPGLQVLARNYGILVTWEHQVPLGAVRLFDFWKNRPGARSR
jgi:hypothetical protein